MLKRILSVLLCFIFMLSQMSTSFASENNEIFNDKVMQAFNNFNVVGASFIVYYKQNKIIEYSFGYADRSNGVQVNSETKFRIASITKMVCAVGLMQLVEQGKISLDEDIGNILGYKVRNPKYPNVPITVRMLASHTSSIIDSSRSANNRGRLEQLIGPSRINDDCFLQFKPGTKYVYSNFGFGIIGSLMEKITGIPVQTYMRENVFSPLNIDAGFSTDEIINKQFAARYENNREIESVRSLNFKSLDESLNPEKKYNITVGKLIISADDLSKILIALSGNGYVCGRTLLSINSVNNIRSIPNYKYNITAKTPYAIGIEKKTDIIDDVSLYGHQGLYYSAYCDAFYDPLNQVTFVLLTNGMDIRRINGTNALARQLIMLTYKYMLDINDPFIVKE